MQFTNSYEDTTRAESYAGLDFPNTYYLAYRDLPRILETHAKGTKALDFGCGTGRSTRFLDQLGFDTVGVDISKDMVDQARAIDPSGNYELINEADFSGLSQNQFDVILSVFTFDNIPSLEAKEGNLGALKPLLKNDGIILMVVSTPDIYINEWASFSTRDFPDNWKAKSGDKVQIIMTDVPDKRPVEDVMFSDASYRNLFKKKRFGIEVFHQPLGDFKEDYQWLNETRIAPWSIYVLKPIRESHFYMHKYFYRI